MSGHRSKTNMFVGHRSETNMFDVSGHRSRTDMLVLFVWPSS